MHSIKRWVWLAVITQFILIYPVLVPESFASSIIQSAYQVIQDEGSSLTRFNTLNFTGAGVTCTNGTGKTVCDIPSASATQQHNITFVINGGGTAITTGALGSFPTAAYSCTINRTDISADQSGSITVDIWKKAGAIPASGDKISASAPVTLSSAQLNQNGSISGWTTTVTSGDVFGGTVASAATVQSVTVQIWCQ